MAAAGRDLVAPSPRLNLPHANGRGRSREGRRGREQCKAGRGDPVKGSCHLDPGERRPLDFEFEEADALKTEFCGVIEGSPRKFIGTSRANKATSRRASLPSRKVSPRAIVPGAVNRAS